MHSRNQPSTKATATTPTGHHYNRPDQEAVRLGISKRLLSNWTKWKRIPVIKCGRVCLFDPTEVDEALSRFRMSAIGE